MGGDGNGVVHRLRAGNVDDLHQSDPRQLGSKPVVDFRREMVAELKGVVRHRRCCATIAAGECSEVSRKVAIGRYGRCDGGDGRLGNHSGHSAWRDDPRAEAPQAIARAASSDDLMQQILTRGRAFTELLRTPVVREPGVPPHAGAAWISVTDRNFLSEVRLFVALRSPRAVRLPIRNCRTSDPISAATSPGAGPARSRQSAGRSVA